MTASVVWGVYLAFSTEALSLFSAFHQGGVRLTWIAALLGAGYFFIKSRSPARLIPRLPVLSRGSVVWLCGIMLILGLAALSAWMAPPNTWDSLSYHMSRIVHWIQNKNVAHFPTHVERELFMNPWAEWAAAHFEILVGSDRLANFIQWASALGCVVGVSLIARELGMDGRGQLFSALTSITIPMGILQASSTQTDYVLSFWLVSFVHGFLKLRRENGFQKTLLWEASLSLGLAVLTRQSAYLFACPFLIWFLGNRVKRLNANAWKPIFLMAVVAITLNTGHYARNYDLYGTPFSTGSKGSRDVVPFTNELFTPGALISNVLRNAGLHMGTPFAGVNRTLEYNIRSAHKFLGVDPDDRRTTFEETRFEIKKISNHEDFAGNPIHAFLLIVSFFALFLRTKKTPALLCRYAVAVASGFLLFCLMIKWQPFNSRLHLPLFILASPVAAAWVMSLRAPPFEAALGAVLLTSSLWYAAGNASRPLVGEQSVFSVRRFDQYFANAPTHKSAYLEVAEYIRGKGVRNIGLLWSGDGFEHVLWTRLRKVYGLDFRMEHIDISDNASGKYSDPAFHPDVVVGTWGWLVYNKDRLNEFTARYGKLSTTTGRVLFIMDKT